MQHLAGRTLARSALRCSRSSAASSSQPSASALAVAARRAASTTTGGPPHQPAAAPVTGAETTFDYNEDPQLAGLGFPKIKEVNRQERNPLGWWDNQERTNFGEPVRCLSPPCPSLPSSPLTVTPCFRSLLLARFITLCRTTLACVSQHIRLASACRTLDDGRHSFSVDTVCISAQCSRRCLTHDAM